MCEATALLSLDDAGWIPAGIQVAGSAHIVAVLSAQSFCKGGETGPHSVTCRNGGRQPSGSLAEAANTWAAMEYSECSFCA